MIRRFVATLAVMVGVFAVLSPAPASAAVYPAQYVGANCGTGVAAFLGLKSWDACLEHDSRGAPVIKRLSDVWLIALPLLEDALKVAAYTAAGFIIWGGVKYIKSQGDPGQFNEARQVITNALFGLLLALISIAIVNFIAGAL